MDRGSGEAGGVPTRGVPVAAALLAFAYLAAVALPALLPAVTVAACVAGCALVLTLRRTPGLRWLLPGLAIWLAVGIAGALLLRGEALRGPAWIAVALFLLPLPVVPWLYAQTFEVAVEDEPSGPPAQIPRCARDDRGESTRDEGGKSTRDDGEATGGAERRDTEDDARAESAPHRGLPEAETVGGHADRTTRVSGPDPGPRTPDPGNEGDR